MRFQPIVSCRETYQDAVFVPCLGAPFIRCIWTVGIKKFAVTVPTLRPLRLLEMRKSMLCACPLTTSSSFLVASLLLVPYRSTKQCVMHAASLPLISHCFETRWQMCSLSFSSSPLQGLPNQYTTPLPASDVGRGFSAAAEQNKTYPVTRQSSAWIPRLFSANSSFSCINGYFLFNEVAYNSYCLRGTLLQSTHSDVFAAGSVEELCGEARRGQEPARHRSHRSSMSKAGDSKHILLGVENNNFVCMRNLKYCKKGQN